MTAVDGSKSNIPYNPKDRSFLHLGKSKANGETGNVANNSFTSSSSILTF